MTSDVAQGTMVRRKLKRRLARFLLPTFLRAQIFIERETPEHKAALTVRLFLTESATQSVKQILPCTLENTSGNLLTFVAIIKSYSSLGNIVQSEANVRIPH